MRSRFPGFATVRVVCSLCGWQRILGPNGTNGEVRALIRVEPARHPRGGCNVVWSEVVIVPGSLSRPYSTPHDPRYRDLEYDWDHRFPRRQPEEAMRRYHEMVEGRPCPRCRRDGGLSVEHYRERPDGLSRHTFSFGGLRVSAPRKPRHSPER